MRQRHSTSTKPLEPTNARTCSQNTQEASVKQGYSGTINFQVPSLKTIDNDVRAFNIPCVRAPSLILHREANKIEDARDQIHWRGCDDFLGIRLRDFEDFYSGWHVRKGFAVRY